MSSSFDSTDLPSDRPSDGADGAPWETEDALRRRAVDTLHARRGFAVQLAVYVLINAVLVWAWATSGFGFPWPLFVLVFWGIGLFWQAWSLFGPGESEDRIRKEMDRLRRTR